MDTQEDDGSLSFLNIPEDPGNRHFNCEQTGQQKLINRTFYVIDYMENIQTKFGQERFLIKIKFNLSDPESETKKFFTNSKEIKYVLRKIREMNKFPRRVTLRANGTRYYFE